MKKIFKDKNFIVNLLILLVMIYLFLGSIIGETIEYPNGNVCRKAPFAFPICSGNIDAE